jgi:hypothetical protein
MDGFSGMKGVMMAERPSAQPSSYGVAEGSGPSSSASIGNYKGVMLCNRPTGTGEGGKHGEGGASHPAGNFRAGIKQERVDPRGYDLGAAQRRAASNMMVHQNKSREPTVFQKHRTWLKEFAEQKRTLEEEKQRLEAEAEERRRKFKERQSELRTQTLSRPAEPSKPAWAMSEKEKAAADDAEADDLLAFAEGLDLDTYLDDVEVRAALDVVRKRLTALDEEHSKREREHKEHKKRDEQEWEYEWVGEEEQEGKDSESEWEWVEPAAAPEGGDQAPQGEGEAPVRRLRRRRRPRADTRSVATLDLARPARVKGVDADDSESVAESMMTTSSSVRHVHSKRSLTAMIEREKSKLKEVQAMPDLPEEEEVVAPHVVTHDEHLNARKEMEERHLAETLPFKNRNPYV